MASDRANRHRLRNPLVAASLLAAAALLLTIGATAAASGYARANGHNGYARLKLTPASSVRNVDPARQCGAALCFRVTVSAQYEYTAAAGGRTCPDVVVLTWDGKAIGSTRTDGSHGSCAASLRRTVSGAGSQPLALGRHTVCATVSGGPPVSTPSICTDFAVLAATATPQPSAAANDQSHPSTDRTPIPDVPAPHATPAPARPTAAAPAVTNAPASPAPPVPQASQTPAATAPAQNPAATVSAAPQPAPAAASAAPQPAPAQDSAPADPAQDPLFFGLLAAAVLLGLADIAYVARAANRNR